jgi:hypothetical protein
VLLIHGAKFQLGTWEKLGTLDVRARKGAHPDRAPSVGAEGERLGTRRFES